MLPYLFSILALIVACLSWAFPRRVKRRTKELREGWLQDPYEPSVRELAASIDPPPASLTMRDYARTIRRDSPYRSAGKVDAK